MTTRTALRSITSCFYCGVPISPTPVVQETERLELDHFSPLSCGGPDVVTNLVPACQRCNRAKKAMQPQEWANECFDASYDAIRRLRWLIGDSAYWQLINQLNFVQANASLIEQS